MSRVCGSDLHRGQVTFGTLEVDSGVEWRGRLRAVDPEEVHTVAVEHRHRRGFRRTGRLTSNVTVSATSS